MSPVLEIRSVSKSYDSGRDGGIGPRETVQAVSDVSFRIEAGETFALVGESGCGKSTLARVILGLTRPSAGEVWFGGARIDHLSRRQMRPVRRHLQIIYQDPFSSLNPRMRVRDIIAEPLINLGIATNRDEVAAHVSDLLEKTRLPASAADRFPHEFSGGQRQRIGIARALASNPDLIVCDEAVAALDVSIKAQIINLLGELQRAYNVAYLFISHDLPVVEHVSHRLAVMYLGRIVELGHRDDVLLRPAHPYTRMLLASVPVAEPGRPARALAAQGEPPSARNPPSGCRFHTRCPYVFERCKVETPRMEPRNSSGHLVACHLQAA